MYLVIIQTYPRSVIVAFKSIRKEKYLLVPKVFITFYDTVNNQLESILMSFIKRIDSVNMFFITTEVLHGS